MSTVPSDDFQQTPTRLYSLDALRGFDMFWIMGAGVFFHNLADASNSGVVKVISDQLRHPFWNGFHFYDLIFPLFLFMAGVSTPYSVGRDLEMGKSRNQLLIKVIKRGLILIILGVIYNNGLQLLPLESIRFPSVLGRIGLAYMLANIIYLYSTEIAQMVWFWALLIGYWLILKFNSAPGFHPGDLTMKGNFASYIDRLILPGKLIRDNIHDPEGLFSTIPAISTGLLGILTGITLKKANLTQQQKAIRLLVVGIILIVLAQIWDLDFPINKNLWSSSFTLQTGGLSLLLMSFFYYVIDVLGYRKWAFFFKVIGMNSILIYISGKFINWDYTNDSFFKWLFQLVGDPWGLVVTAITFILIKWLFLYLLYQKKIFLRV